MEKTDSATKTSSGSQDSSELRSLFDLIPELGFAARPDGFVEFFNQAWYTYTGTTFEEVGGWGWTLVHDPDLVESVVARWRQALASGTPSEMETRLRGRDGRLRWFSTRVTPLRDSKGDVVRWVGIHTDVTASKASADEAQVRLQIEEEHDRFFAMSLDLIAIVGFDGYLRRASPSWTKTLGFSIDELKAKHILEFVHPDDVAKTATIRAQLVGGQAMARFQNRYLCKSGGYRWLEWRSVPLMDDGRIYAMGRDVTEENEAREAQERTRKRLLVADRMASVGTLAAGVAHEINNPLSYVMSNLDVALEEIRRHDSGPQSGSMKELTEMINDAREGADRVRKIVRALNTFSRTDVECRTVMDVRPALELAIKLSWNEIRHRARLVKDYGPTPLIEADDARLGQVFVNLLVNAAQAIPEGNVDENEIRIVTSTDSSGSVVVEIRDSGSGMSEAVRDRIFEPFFTTKNVGVGTGLGLSICHNIVSGMGGEISATSELGRGTTLRVVLPAAPADQLGQRAAVATPPEARRRARVLVVDDEVPVGAVLARSLKAHDVTVVTRVQEALDLISSGARFDVIFSDLMMPQMTGADFYGELSARCPELLDRVVFMTGGAFTPVASEFLDRVTNERMQKPFTPQIVRALVDKLIGADVVR